MQYLKNILFTEQDRFGLITHKEIDYALYDKGCVWLSRVHARGQNDGRSFGDVVLGTLQIGDDQHVQRVASDRAAHLGSFQTVLGGLRIAHAIQKLHQVRICVRITVTQINSIAIVIESDFEAESVGGGLARNLLDFLSSLKVPDVVSTSVPSVSCCLYVFLRVHQRLHALIVGGICFE